MPFCSAINSKLINLKYNYDKLSDYLNEIFIININIKGNCKVSTQFARGDITNDLHLWQIAMEPFVIVS